MSTPRTQPSGTPHQAAPAHQAAAGASVATAPARQSPQRPASGGSARAVAARKYRITFPRLVASELRKITSLRSTFTTIGLMTVLPFLLLLPRARSIANDEYHGAVDAQIITSLTQLFMIFMLVLGALAVTGEYSSNTMRTTALSSRSRLASFSAKCVSVFLVAGIAMAALLTVLMLGLAVAIGKSPDFGTSNLRWLGLAWLVTVAYALMGTGIGYALRSTAGTITSLLGMLWLTQLVMAIPVDFVKNTLRKYDPIQLVNNMTAPDAATNDYTPLSAGQSAAAWLVYLAIFLLLGFLRYRHRDI